MARLQLALNVNDLDAAVDFYSRFFGAEPAKVRPGYANFAITDPPLKLVLMETGGAGGTVNHLGVEVEDPEQVGAASARLAGADLDLDVEGKVTCCYAAQDKVWTEDPDGSAWEVYTVLADRPEWTPPATAAASCGPGCCSPGEG